MPNVWRDEVKREVEAAGSDVVPLDTGVATTTPEYPAVAEPAPTIADAKTVSVPVAPAVALSIP